MSINTLAVAIALYFTKIVDSSQGSKAVENQLKRLAQVGKEAKAAIEAVGDIFESSKLAPSGDAWHIQLQCGPFDTDIVEELVRTARELQDSAKSATPQPLKTRVTSMRWVPFLKVIANSHVAGDPVPTCTDADGTHEIPVLSPGDFLEAFAEKGNKELKGTFPINAISFSEKNGYRVSATGVPSVINLNERLLTELLPMPNSALGDGIWLDGTVVETNNGDWETESGCTLVSQIRIG